jgi:tRNA threonylcarbamoyladenosine biosynthesis protein TsaB
VCAPGGLATALGDGVEGALAGGDGAVRFRSEIEAAGFVVPADEDPANRLSAARICELAATMEPGGARFPAAVTPKYMRRPDAERWRERDNRS